MTNTVELQGSFCSEKWSISFQALDFFEAMLEKVQFTLSDGNAEAPPYFCVTGTLKALTRLKQVL